MNLIILLVIIFGTIFGGVAFAIVYPMNLCNEVKEEFELDNDFAMEKYGHSSFQEWIKNSNMAMNENCWWESNLANPDNIGWI